MTISSFQTPELGTGVFLTTYTYLNTFMDGDQPLVVTSKHTVSNTITAPEDFFSLLHPSEPGATLFETNTYYNTVAFTKTLTDSDVSKVISTTDVVRQVVITELLPSKSRSVMTSYIAIDAAGNQSPANKHDHPASPLLSATDVVKTYYVTYTYFNTYLVNGSSIVRTNVSTSSDIVTEKLYIYPTTPVLTTATATAQAKPEPSNEHVADDNLIDSESLKQLINVYATKTFMTTFTYYTTIEQGGDESATDSPNDKDLLSTVVLSQTSVVENVVTESIPMKYLPSSAIKRLKLMLFGNNKATAIAPFASQSLYSTVVTLLGGQALEITAKRQPMSTAQPSSPLPAAAQEDDESGNGGVESSESNDETKNELEVDQETAGTSDVEVLEGAGPPDSAEASQETRPVLKTNATKIHKTPASTSPVSNLIGSWNFNGLKALRPMIDAVAGLIHNNFGKTRQNETINIINNEYHSTALPLHHVPLNKLPAIPDYIANYNAGNASASQAPVPLPNIEPAVGQARNPIYIPVNGENGVTPVPGLSTLNSIAGTSGAKPERLNEILNQKNPNGKHKIPLLNGGIPISPGEIITANSDVILGRPTGNRPRIPLHNNANANGENVQQLVHDSNTPFNMLPPLISPPAVGRPPGDSHTVSSIQSETYVGPPPPQQTQQLPHVLKSSKHYMGQSTPAHLNKIPIYRNKPLFRVPPGPHLQQSLVPPHQFAQMHRLHGQSQLRPHAIPINHVAQVQSQHLIPPNIPAFNPQIPTVDQAGPPHGQQGPASGDNMQRYVINNMGGYGTEIEIQRAPEVFSTDLPPVHIISQQQKIVSMAEIDPSRFIDATRTQEFVPATKQLPEVIESLTGQPLFVNIQPSQMANVVLPHGSSSALIYGGVQELHKSGEYFDDGSPYPDDNESQVTFIGHSKPILTASSVFVETVPPQQSEVGLPQQAPVNVPQDPFGRIAAHLSNQKVNVHSHVQNQDVDMQVPPIIFEQSNGESSRVNEVPVIHGDFERERPQPPSFLEQTHFQQSNPEQSNAQQLNAQQTPPYRPQSPFHVDIESINVGMSHTADQSSSASVEATDNEPIDHAQAPAADDPVDDHHKDDDYENEQGEVIQESNAVPQLVSSGQVLSDSLNRIPSFAKPNKSEDGKETAGEEHNTQPPTERTTATSTTESSAAHRDVPHQMETFRIPQIPPAMINSIRPINQSLPSPPNFQTHNSYANTLIPLQHLQPPPRFPAPSFEKWPLTMHRQPSILAHNVQKHPIRAEPSRYPSFLTNQLPPVMPPHIQYFNNLATESFIRTTTPPATQPQMPAEPAQHSTHWQLIEETTTESEPPTSSTTLSSAAVTTPTWSTPFDLTRGKPFAMKSQLPPHLPPHLRPHYKAQSTTALNLNTGEVKLTTSGENITRPTQPAQSSEQRDKPPKYLPTPSTEMRPPPALRGPQKFKPFGQQQKVRFTAPTVPAVSQNVHVEEVMGMHPPPLPNIRYSHPTRNHQNKPPTPATTKATPFTTEAPQRRRPTNSSIQLPSQIVHLPRPTVRYQPVRDTPAPTTAQTPQKFSYQSINRVRTTTEAPASEEAVEPIVHADGRDEYVHFKVGGDSSSAPATHEKEYVAIRRPSITEQPPIEAERPKVPIHEDERNVLVLGAEREIQSINVSRPLAIKPTPTLVASVESVPHEPVEFPPSIRSSPASTSHALEPSTVEYSLEMPTKYITNTKTLTVTTTKTTVIRSAGVTTTLTLTLTKTQTITMVDTITTTHTLIKPTHITHEPVIRPTIFTAPVVVRQDAKSASPLFGMSPASSDDGNDSNTSDEIESEEKEALSRVKTTQKARPSIRPTASGTVVSTPDDTIFVVMTDKKSLGTIHLNTSALGSPSNAKADKTEEDDDEAYFDLPKRDEEDVSNDVSHVLLGGILIASPPRSEISKNSPKDGGRKQSEPGHQRPHHYDIDVSSEIGEQLDVSADNAIGESKNEVNRIVGADVKCEPKCGAINNEICQLVDGVGRCVCRPGFARIFSDRPCKRNLLPTVETETNFDRLSPSPPLIHSHIHVHTESGHFAIGK